MKISFYGYHSFLIESGDKKIAINPGALFFYWFRFTSLFPKPDVLMLPIGGKAVHNTMDASEALQAVKIMKPKMVIPCHYNCPALFTKKYNPADDMKFKRDVEALDSQCVILSTGDFVELNHG